MINAIIPFVSALIGGGLVAWVNYKFGLRQADKQKRKEIEVSHLIGAYLALEDYALREPSSPKYKDRVAAIENATASVFLFGDKKSIELLKEIDLRMKAQEGFDVKELALHLRSTLRENLGLDMNVSDEIIHFRGPDK